MTFNEAIRTVQYRLWRIVYRCDSGGQVYRAMGRMALVAILDYARRSHAVGRPMVSPDYLRAWADFIDGKTASIPEPTPRKCLEMKEGVQP